MSDSRYYQRRINQKIAYARQLAHDAGEAALEAAVWHLSVAYKAWLAEIVHDKHHPLPSRDMSCAVAIADTCDKHIPAALAECVQLEINTESWLTQLQAFNDAANSLINTPPKKVLAGMIALSDASDVVLPSTENVIALINQLEQMIERYREAMQEY